MSLTHPHCCSAGLQPSPPCRTAALDSLDNSGPLPLLSPWKPSFSFLLLRVWQLQTLRVRGTMWNSCFWDCLLSLTVLKVHPRGAMWQMPRQHPCWRSFDHVWQFISGLCILFHRSLSISMPIPCCFGHCRFVTCLRSGCARSLAVFLSRDYHGYSGSFEIPNGY